jgi:hypothetical protein
MGRKELSMAREIRSKPVVAAELPAIPAEAGQAEGPQALQKSKKKQKQWCKRLMLKLHRELDFRLENVSMINGEPKAAFALRLVEQGLRGYKVDSQLRAVYAEISRQASETTKEAAA